MKLFYPISHYHSNSRTYLFPLLRAIQKEDISLEHKEDRNVCITGKNFCFTQLIEKSDVIILTMSWNYYVKYKKEKQAIQLIAQANALQKPVWLAMVDDVGFAIPKFRNTTIYRYSGYASKLPKNHEGLPVFIPDPNSIDSPLKNRHFPKYKQRPIVGFCGLASKSPILRIKQLFKILLKNIAFYFKLYNYTPNTLIAVQYLRYQSLNQLEKTKGIDTHFIIRNKYRAGAKTDDERYTSKQEFYNNILESQYVFCVRGAGNFSARLYETLAMGRIPVYLHTNDLLPFADKIDWKRHVVWVNWHERGQIAKKVLEFHANHDDESLRELSLNNRLLWETHLQMGTFFDIKLSSLI